MLIQINCVLRLGFLIASANFKLANGVNFDNNVIQPWCKAIYSGVQMVES